MQKILILVALAGGLLLPLKTSAGPWFATGQSALADPRAAAVEAATKAKTALGESPAKLVVVFAGKSQYGAALVDGIASVFDKKLIYGGTASAPITQDGNFADQIPDATNSVAVLVIGGGCQVTAASAVVEKSTNQVGRLKVHYVSGLSVGDQLKSAYDQTNSGKFVLTFGNQHAGPNQAFAEGVTDVLGKNLKMVGGASGGDNSREIVVGELVTSVNIGILLTGNFKVVTTSSRDEPLKAADDLLKGVVTEGSPKPAVIFFFEDHLRRNALGKAGTLAQESKLITADAAGLPLFGMDDSGEIGHDTPTAVPVGAAMRTVVAAIIPQ